MLFFSLMFPFHGVFLFSLSFSLSPSFLPFVSLSSYTSLFLLFSSSLCLSRLFDYLCKSLFLLSFSSPPAAAPCREISQSTPSSPRPAKKQTAGTNPDRPLLSCNTLIVLLSLHLLRAHPTTPSSSCDAPPSSSPPPPPPPPPWPPSPPPYPP